MDIAAIVEALEAERDRLNQAIVALQGGRAGKGRRGRRLSAAARRKISVGMKQRWAARKKAA
jgi:exonuclease VII small subunit